ncbi:MAG: transposase [Candidatus Brocadiales bacterium]|nr:transposase [Candidatus Brocadiales bacterium]
MAELKIVLENNRYQITLAGFCFEFPGGCPDNQKALILFLRGFKKYPGAKHGLFTQEQIAKALPEFSGATKQSIQDHERHFEESGYNIRFYLNRKRKVDEVVVEALAKELEEDVLAGKEELAKRVNERLGRKDLSAPNMEAGLEQIPADRLRKIIRNQLAKGEAHYQEKHLLERVFEALESKDPEEKRRALTLLERAQIQENDEEGMKLFRPDEETLKDLCTPDKPLSEIPLTVRWAVVSLVLYGYGVPLRVLGRWLGVHKTTVLRWILSLSLGLWELISAWIVKSVKGKLVYIDEKWIKIKGKWYYWFVALDGDTELPIVQDLMEKRTGWNCLWIITKLKKMGFDVKTFVTDGLKGYIWAIPRVFGGAIHQLCLFHNQQNITKFVKENCLDEKEREIRKKEMKKVFEVKDKRTVKSRLTRLEGKSEAWGIGGWLKGTWEQLSHLLPAIGNRQIPRTSNAVERFFRAFNRFYKVRRGFHSVQSAKHQLILFLVFYLFTQGEEGVAPIERVVPDARRMPLYRLMNDPFRSLGLGVEGEEETEKVKESRPYAENRLRKAS